MQYSMYGGFLPYKQCFLHMATNGAYIWPCRIRPFNDKDILVVVKETELYFDIGHVESVKSTQGLSSAAPLGPVV